MILVCGEALIDVFAADAGGSDALCLTGHPGGSPLNVAVGLSRLGRKAAYCGALSNDMFGVRLRRHLGTEGVDLRFAKTSSRRTPLSIVAVDGEGRVAYDFRNSDAADDDLLAADLPAALPAEINCLTVGSYALGLARTGKSVTALAEREGRGRVVSFDPNVRLDLLADRALWQARFDRVAKVASIVKISREDIDLAFGAEADTETLVADLRSRGIALVAVTDGTAPIRLFGAFGAIAVPSEASAVVDTVGAGDSFHAALLAHLDTAGLLTRDALAALSGTEAVEAARFAARAAAITCARRGADLPRLAEIGGFSG